jgi:phage tail protein
MSDKQRIAALGGYRFVLDKNEYNSLQRAIEYRWDKTDIINNRPNYQNSGIGEESISINGAVFNYKSNQDALDSPVTETGVDQITQLRDEAQKGVPLLLTFDDGRNFGYWIVKSISEQHTNLIGASPLKQSYTIQLAYFGDKL